MSFRKELAIVIIVLVGGIFVFASVTLLVEDTGNLAHQYWMDFYSDSIEGTITDGGGASIPLNSFWRWLPLVALLVPAFSSSFPRTRNIIAWNEIF